MTNNPRCPHCRSKQTVKWGAAHGLPRRRCKLCGQTFNPLTKTPLARVQHKKRWLTYLKTEAQRKSVRASARACGVSTSTVARWKRDLRDGGSVERVRLLGALLTAVLMDSEVIADLSLYNELIALIGSMVV